MGYSEEDAQLLEKLQTDMKKFCDESGGVDIVLRGRGEGALPYHDMMLPHWKKFAKTLSSGRTSVEYIGFTGISLPVSLLDIVFPALQVANIVELSLFGTGLGNDGFQCLSSFLENSSSLTMLGVGADKIDELSVATSLSDALKIHPSLEEVFISLCIGHNTSVLEKILQGCTTAKRLTVTMQYFDLYGPLVDIVAHFIRSNHPVEILYLDENNISDNDTKLLASALKMNKHLKRLDLLENDDITDEGEKALMNVLYDPTSMDSVVESNHICMVNTDNNHTIVALEQRPLIDQEVLKINKGDYSIKEKIRKKVVLALCGVDGELFDLSLLNDVPLQLMPRILELIQDHTAIRSKNAYVQLKKDALSRLFHTLRGWELPSLFVNLITPPDNVACGKRKRRKTRR